MFYLRKKDVKNRVFFHKKEKLSVIYKYIFFSIFNRCYLKKGSVKFNKVLFVCKSMYYNKFSRLSSKTRLLRRCVVSNRNRANSRSFGGLSRIVIRDFIHSGVIPGYKKAVW